MKPIHIIGAGMAGSEATAASRSRHLPGIHGLRAAAALAVVTYHTCYICRPFLDVPPLLAPAVSNMGLSVHLFFIVSAFSLLHTYDSTSRKPGWVYSYAVKRFFRIAPLFYVLLLFWISFARFTTPVGTIAANVSFTFNFLPTEYTSMVWAGWTLGVEMPVYAVLPLLIHRFRETRAAVSITVVALAFSIAARLVIASSSLPADYAYFSLAGNAGVFALGALVFHFVNSGTLQSHGLGIMVAGAGAGLLLLATVASKPFAGGARLDVLLWSLPLALLCGWQAVQPSRLMASTIMQWIGERSYSIYLLHPLVVYVLWQAGVYDRIFAKLNMLGSWSFVICVAITVALTLSLAAVTYMLVERPGQKLGRLIAGH